MAAKTYSHASSYTRLFSRNSLIFSSLILTISLAKVNGDCTLIASNHSDDSRQLLHRLDPLKTSTFTVTRKFENLSKVYEVRICSDVPPQKDNKFPNVGVLQVQESKTPQPIGLNNATEIKGGTDWIMLTYKNGANFSIDSKCVNVSAQSRQAYILITCDPTVLEGELIFLETNRIVDEDCVYLFRMRSSVACQIKDDGLSGGSVFCIIFFTVAAIYLIIGFLYQRIVVGAKGFEQIPNFTFWKNFGRLQADGCDFLCRCGERQEAKMYRGIDDQLLNEGEKDDHDDHLLPM